MIRVHRSKDELDALSVKHLKGVKQRVADRLFWVMAISEWCSASGGKVIRRKIVGFPKLDVKTKWKLLRLIKTRLKVKKNVCESDVQSAINSISTRKFGSVIDVCRNRCDGVKSVLDHVDDHLDDILGGQPKVIEKIEKDLRDIYQAWGQTEQAELENLFRFIFDYDGWSGHQKCGSAIWTPYDLAREYDLKVCPYCNRQYTSTVWKEKGEGVIRPDFDHFFNQLKHPVLSLSFYNLIPSCSSCNSRLKGKEEFSLGTHMHPLFEGFDDDERFSYDYTKTDGRLGEIENSVRIKWREPKTLISDERRQKIVKHQKVFSIEAIYQEHRDIVSELIAKAKNYPPVLFDELRAVFGLKFTKSDVARLFLGNYVGLEQLEKRPLAKLTRDICLELELIDSKGELQHITQLP
jgi:hypothetical protein